MPLITPKDLTAGQIIYDIKPVAHIVCQEFKNKFCDNCLKRSDGLLKCKICGQMYYCGKECQKQDWKTYHKNECQHLANKKFNSKHFLDEEMLFLRIYLRLKTCDSFAIKKYDLFDGSQMCLNDIEFDEEVIKKDTERMEEFGRVCSHMRSIGIKCDDKRLLHWFGCLSSNPSHVGLKWYGKDPKDYDLVSEIICRAFCPQLSSLKHSCLPNAAHVTNGLSLQLRAIKDMNKSDEITISYIRLDQNKDKRLMQLKTDFYMQKCQCLKCDQNLDKTVNYEAFDDIIKRELSQFATFTPSDPKTWIQLQSLSERVIPLYCMVYGDYHPFLTATLMECSMATYMTAKIAHKSAHKWKPLLLEYYRLVDQHLKVTHGIDHPLYDIFYSSFVKM